MGVTKGEVEGEALGEAEGWAVSSPGPARTLFDATIKMRTWSVCMLVFIVLVFAMFCLWETLWDKQMLDISTTSDCVTSR